MAERTPAELHAAIVAAVRARLEAAEAMTTWPLYDAKDDLIRRLAQAALRRLERHQPHSDRDCTACPAKRWPCIEVRDEADAWGVDMEVTG